MKGIIDIHNHILYGVDDGATNEETSMQLIKEGYKQGVRTFIFTPHYQGDEYTASQKTIHSRFDKIKEAVAQKYSDVELYLGNEILYEGDAVDQLKKKNINSLADSQYVLVEFYPSVQYNKMESNIRTLLLNGYVPIVAHCERYNCLRRNKDRVNHLVDVGAYLQVNAQSVFRLKTSRFVDMLIKNDNLHFIASDAHDTSSRGFVYDRCIKKLEKKYEDDYIKMLLIDNPRKVINGEYI